MKEQLTEANLLNKEINHLKRFIDSLDVTGLWREKSNVTALIKRHTEVKTTYSIFGRRFFGIGAHEHTIDVPTSMIPSLVVLSKELLKEKENQLEKLFSHA